MLGPFIVLAIALSGILFAVGATGLAKRILVGGILLALLVPIALCALGGATSSLPFEAAVTPAALILLGLALVAGLVRFVNHRRQLHHWIGDERTSQKRRVEGEP